jgi:hypothetical protein
VEVRRRHLRRGLGLLAASVAVGDRKYAHDPLIVRIDGLPAAVR